MGAEKVEVVNTDFPSRNVSVSEGGKYMIIWETVGSRKGCFLFLCLFFDRRYLNITTEEKMDN